jgi:hypothetical protein
MILDEEDQNSCQSHELFKDGLMVNSVDTEIAQMSKPSDMTIHWKALEEHFLMVPLVFLDNDFREKNAFSEIFSKNLISIVKELIIWCHISNE